MYDVNIFFKIVCAIYASVNVSGQLSGAVTCIIYFVLYDNSVVVVIYQYTNFVLLCFDCRCINWKI